MIETWRRHCDTLRPHSALDYRLPAPEAVAWPAWALLGPAAGYCPDGVHR